MYLFDDKQATSRIISTGKYPTLGHMRRMHGVCISWLHDAYKQGVFQLFDCTTEYEAADIFTKHFTDVRRWRHALDLIGLVHDKSLLQHLHACEVGSGGCSNPVVGRGSSTKPPVALSLVQAGGKRKTVDGRGSVTSQP